MKFKWFLCLVVLSVVASCSTRTGRENQATIDIDMSFSGSGVNVPFQLSGMIDSVSYLRIDSSVVVGNVSNVKYVGGYYYILDGTARIHKMDESGRVLFTLEKRGRGPGEYLAITYFDINPETEDILVFDQVGWKLSVYDRWGKFKGSRKLVHGCNDTALLPSGKILFCYLYRDDDGNHKRGLWCEDFQGKGQKTLLEFDDDYRMVVTDPFMLSFRHLKGGGIGFLDNSRDVVFHIDRDGTAAERYQLHFDRSIPASVRRRDERVDPFRDDRVYSNVQYFETDNWLLVSSICNLHRIDLYYDKREGKIHLTKNDGDLVNDVGIVPRNWWWSSGDRLIAFFHPDKSDQVSARLVPDLDDSSNPVLVIAHVN